MTADTLPAGLVRQSAPALFGTGGEAVFSEDMTYRYELRRIWGTGSRLAAWVMLNPSTADAFVPDHTITKCIGFTKAWGLDGLIVVNLFAWRATKPADMRAATDPVGTFNDQFIRDGAREASVVIAAWGVHGSFRDRDLAVTGMLADVALHCLTVTKEGHPGHPLLIPYATPLTPYTPREVT